jgi:hypothetical protein
VFGERVVWWKGDEYAFVDLGALSDAGMACSRRLLVLLADDQIELAADKQRQRQLRFELVHFEAQIGLGGE